MNKVATVLFAYYPQDVRARRQSEALAEAGMQVDMICLKLDSQQEEEEVNGVRVHRLPMQKERGDKLNYLAQYGGFLLKSLLKLSKLHLQNRFDCVHVHNMPDILILSAIVPKLTGSRIVLDLRDPMPELFMTKFSVGRSHPVIRLLAFLESASVRFADKVITPNISFRELFVSRGCPRDKISIVMNSPMEKIFSSGREPAPPSARKDPGKFVVMFHGTIFDRHGIDTALEAIAGLKEELPGIELRIFGEGDFSEYSDYVQRNGLGEVVKYHGPVSWERISEEIKGVDLGIIPNKKTPFTDLNFPGRIFEYLSLGKAVIAPRTQGVLDYFDEGSIFFFDPGSSASLTDAMRRVHRDDGRVREVVAKGMAVYRQHRWELQKERFVEQVKGLIAELDSGRVDV